MATIKSYTDLSQSKKLAEILPIESADIGFLKILDSSTQGYSFYLPYFKALITNKTNFLPCWSLAALLKILNDTAYSIDEDASIDLGSYKTSAWSLCLTNIGVGELIEEPNPIDACYEMILNLKEQKLL